MTVLPVFDDVALFRALFCTYSFFLSNMHAHTTQPFSSPCRHDRGHLHCAKRKPCTTCPGPFLPRDVAKSYTKNRPYASSRMYTPCLPKLERVCHPAFRAIPPTVPTNAVVRLQAPSIAVAARRELGVMLVQCVIHASLTTNKNEQNKECFFSRRGGSVRASKRDRGVGVRGAGKRRIFFYTFSHAVSDERGVLLIIPRSPFLVGLARRECLALAKVPPRVMPIGGLQAAGDNLSRPAAEQCA